VGGSFGAAVLVVILTRQAAARTAGLATAFGHTFWWCVGFTALAVIPALLMPGRPARPDRPDPPGRPTPGWDRSTLSVGRP
jgi:hypothetical protein